jgi:hypothetical protein
MPMTIAYFSVVSWGAEFIYPAVILKAFSRRVVGCAGRTLEAQLTVAALRMALIEKQPVRASLHNAGLSEVASEVREKQNPALLGYLEPHPATITKSANAATVSPHPWRCRIRQTLQQVAKSTRPGVFTFCTVGYEREPVRACASHRDVI